ncbi:MAG: acyl carrier protein [Arenicella sp.]|nr:acyl carrier protein [Arenicella sp.]
MDNHAKNEVYNATHEQICQWMVSHLSQVLNIDAKQVDITLEFDDYGLDSRDAVGMIGELGEWLQLDLDPNLIYEYRSINELSIYVVNQVEAQ